MSALISILTIYFFIFLGYTAKKVFKDEIDERTLILISIYFLQPILTFWGLTRTPLNFNIFLTPFIYFITVTTVLVLLFFISKYISKDKKEQSIFIATSLIGNTGNLGIPLGIALFGESSIVYTSIINIANILFIYTMGIYLFAKEEYTIKQSLLSMVKIPILWFAILALIFNYFSISINENIQTALQMGAYSTIVLQLMIFGIYLTKVKIKEQNYILNLSTTTIKLIVLPMVGIFYSFIFNLDPFIASILIVSLSMPLAVNNVNIASLFNCKPYLVANIVFVSTILFLIIFYFDLKFIKMVF